MPFSTFSRNDYVIAGALLAAILDHANEGHTLRMMDRKTRWSLGP